MNPSPAASASCTVREYISARPALMVVSAGVSAVQARLATCPGGVIVARLAWLPGSTGPFSVQRRVSVTGAAPLMFTIEGRVSKGLNPSGVRYSSGLSGLSCSMNRS